MSTQHMKTSRRGFFLRGGAALGAGMATGAGAGLALPAAAADGDAHALLAQVRDREAIRQLHLQYLRAIEARDFAAATAVFAEQARLSLSGATAAGRTAIGRLFGEGYRDQSVEAMHDAYRANARQHEDSISFTADGREATARWHVDVALGTPLRGDSTAAQMARLQGQLADRRWVSGVLEASYIRSAAGWKVTALGYRDT